MSLDFTLTRVRPVQIYWQNITHNLADMAKEAEVYGALWRPDENGFKLARDIIPVLERGLADLRARPDHYRQFDSPNGWGRYENFVPFVEGVLEACRENPGATIEVSR